MSPALDWRRNRIPLSIVVLAGVAALALYDTQVNDGYTIGTWLAAPLDWLFILANVVLLFYGVLPILEDRERAATVWKRFREKPEAIAGAVWLVVVYLLGTVGLALVPAPKLDFIHGNQPPVWGTIPVEQLPDECAGPVSDGVCHGSWQYPLGTDVNGYAMEILLLQGLHVTLYVAVIALALIVPLALVVGTVSGYHGGLVDNVSMRAVEVQDAVPPLVMYLLLIWITGESLLIIILLFGFLGWGGAARVVRSEARRLRNTEFVEAAKVLGGTDRHVLRKHVLPAVSVVAVPTATQQAPVLLLTEAGLAFLGLEAFDLQSLGNVIARGVVGGEVPMLVKWWVSLFPAVALAATVVAFKLVGDALVEALDPRLG
ncbi:MAG: ABC transporter permease [Halolamina sp.]